MLLILYLLLAPVLKVCACFFYLLVSETPSHERCEAPGGQDRFQGFDAGP